MAHVAPALLPRNPAFRPPSAAPSAVLIRIPFHDAELHAVRDGSDVWVSVRRTSEDLGVSAQGQLAKLNDRPWATVKLILMVAADGKARETCCIHLDALPMWLATIEPSRVAEHIRPRLVAFQRDAARVLRDHFFGLAPTTKQLPTKTMDPYLQAALELRAPVPERVARAVALMPRPPRDRFRTWVTRIDEATALTAPKALPASNPFLEELGAAVAMTAAMTAATGKTELADRWCARLQRAEAIGASSWADLAAQGDDSAALAAEGDRRAAAKAKIQA